MGQICSKYKLKKILKQDLYNLQQEVPPEQGEIASPSIPTLPTNKISLQYSYRLPINIKKHQWQRTLQHRSSKLEYIEPVFDTAFLKKISCFNEKFSRFFQHHPSLQSLKEVSFDVKRSLFSLTKLILILSLANSSNLISKNHKVSSKVQKHYRNFVSRLSRI